MENKNNFQQDFILQDLKIFKIDKFLKDFYYKNLDDFMKKVNLIIQAPYPLSFVEVSWDFFKEFFFKNSSPQKENNFIYIYQKTLWQKIFQEPNQLKIISKKFFNSENYKKTFKMINLKLSPLSKKDNIILQDKKIQKFLSFLNQTMLLPIHIVLFGEGFWTKFGFYIIYFCSFISELKNEPQKIFELNQFITQNIVQKNKKNLVFVNDVKDVVGFIMLNSKINFNQDSLVIDDVSDTNNEFDFSEKTNQKEKIKTKNKKKEYIN
jgi:hypothetical protein